MIRDVLRMQLFRNQYSPTLKDENNVSLMPLIVKENVRL